MPEETYLVSIYTDVVPVVHVGIDVQVVQGIRDKEGIRFALELGSGHKHAVVGIAQVLERLQLDGVEKCSLDDRHGRLYRLHSCGARRERSDASAGID